MVFIFGKINKKPFLAEGYQPIPDAQEFGPVGEKHEICLAYKIFLGHIANAETTIGAVITVITHEEITIGRNNEFPGVITRAIIDLIKYFVSDAIWQGLKVSFHRVDGTIGTFIDKILDPFLFNHYAVYIKPAILHLDMITRQTYEPFYKIGRRIAVRTENDDITTFGLVPSDTALEIMEFITERKTVTAETIFKF
jgi:hypothetical protein